MDDRNLDGVERAIIFATMAHQTQKRKYTGEPYIFHPIEVANMCIEYNLPYWAVCAAVLHDVIEDCGVTESEIRVEFGEFVADAVAGLTEKSKPEDGNRAARKRIDAEWYASQRAEVQTIKVLDMMSNTKSIKTHDEKFWEVYRKEKIELLKMLELADKKAVTIAFEMCND